jgi:ribonuclease R
MSKHKKNKQKSKQSDKRNLTAKIITIFEKHPKQGYNYKQIAAALEIYDPKTVNQIKQIINSLSEKEYITEIKKGKYRYSSKPAIITGKVDMAKAGYAFIISDDIEEDVFVSQKNLNHALDGDTVKVHCYSTRKGKRLEGEVIEILKHARKNFVGIIEVSKSFGFLIPDTKTSFDLFIPIDKLNGAQNGDKVVARIVEWPDNFKNPFGEVVKILGKPGEHETEMHAIIEEFELPYNFPEEVETFANKINDKISENDYKERLDYRDVVTFTIDPIDAKDFDDALSIRKLNNGHWEIGVHIADVTYYVKPNTILDEEAIRRGTSVYLVDRVVPMLPERLSNHICSLKPNEEKLCYSVIFELNDNADIINFNIARTIIISKKRFTYEEAQKIIETGKGEFFEQLIVLNNLAQKLRTQRYKNGAIAFERLEVKFNIDEFGKPLGVYYRENKESNQLIEEFMLLANKTVAEFIGKQKESKKARTFVYRIHDRPNREKLDAFKNFIKKFGYSIKMNSSRALSESMNQLLENVKGKSEQNIIETLAVRSMAKAEYSTNNIGHYGLAFDYYSHFTSPIRRYPDIMAHRLLTHYINGGKSENKEYYEALCRISSDAEKRAIEAERASIKYKQVEFMMDKIGQRFEGIISGVTEWGIFVELDENKCEGLVSVREMDDDIYEFDEKNYCLIGRYYKRKYQLGDKVEVELTNTNLNKKHIDFKLVKSK